MTDPKGEEMVTTKEDIAHRDTGRLMLAFDDLGVQLTLDQNTVRVPPVMSQYMSDLSYVLLSDRRSCPRVRGCCVRRVFRSERQR